jgi:hypothetical protein
MNRQPSQLRPFGKHYIIQTQKQKAWLRLFHTINAIKDRLIDSIPVHIPTHLHWFIFAFYLLVLITSFISLFITGYRESVGKAYLAPLSDGFTSANTGCSLNHQVNTGKYFATAVGTWEGSKYFNYSQAVYRLSLTSYAASQTEYEYFMMTIYQQITKTGAIMEQSDLGKNLVYWMTVVLVNEDSNAQTMTLVGDPLIVFDRQYFTGSLSTISGTCIANNITEFDAPNGRAEIAFSMHEYLYVYPEDCAGFMNPYYFGYDTASVPLQFTIQLDIRTIVTATAVNYQLLALNALVTIDDSHVEIATGIPNMNVSVAQYYNWKFPGMLPVYCVEISNRRVCIIGVGSAYAIPFMFHMGANISQPNACQCHQIALEELQNNPQHACHQMRFLYGIMFWNTLSIIPLIEYIQHNIKQPSVFEDAYHAAYFAFAFLNHDHQEEFNNPLFRSQYYEFCKTPSGGYCSLLVFAAYDDLNDYQNSSSSSNNNNNNNFWISPNYYQLKQGACRDSVSPSIENW